MGNAEGFSTISHARDYLLTLSNDDDSEEEGDESRLRYIEIDCFYCHPPLLQNCRVVCWRRFSFYSNDFVIMGGLILHCSAHTAVHVRDWRTTPILATFPCVQTTHQLRFDNDDDDDDSDDDGDDDDDYDPVSHFAGIHAADCAIRAPSREVFVCCSIEDSPRWSVALFHHVSHSCFPVLLRIKPSFHLLRWTE